MRLKFLLGMVFVTVCAFAQSSKKVDRNNFALGKQVNRYDSIYECVFNSNNRGHDLIVKVDVCFDSTLNEKLLTVEIKDLENSQVLKYKVNPNRGSITISSCGSNGSNGNNGFDGSNGLDGSSGIFGSESQTVSDGDGNLSTIYVTTEGPGESGSDGIDGENGGDGENGYDGGNISISYTKAAEPFLNIIKIRSLAGNGGNGGSGGKGGKGGSGGHGNPNGNSGIDGRDGYSGANGLRGKEGEIIFIPIQSN